MRTPSRTAMAFEWYSDAERHRSVWWPDTEDGASYSSDSSAYSSESDGDTDTHYYDSDASAHDQQPPRAPPQPPNPPSKPPPATAAELRRAHFGEPHLSYDAPRPHMRLRRQETSYTNRYGPAPNPATTAAAPPPAILPIPPAHTRKCASLDDAFAAITPKGDDREVAGYLVDHEGKPYAKVMHSRPPPPNANHTGSQEHGHRLRRAMGYDPSFDPKDVRPKREAAATVNGADVLNGDADIADARRDSRYAALQRSDTFHNRSHADMSAAQDTGRSAMYDGHNASTLARSFERSRRAPEHTWRDALAREHAPTRPGAGSTGAASRVAPRTTAKRQELASAFHRPPVAGDHSTVSVDATRDLPVVSHQSRREGVVSIEHVGGAVPVTARGRALGSGNTDALAGAREAANASTGPKQFANTLSARRAEAVLAQRRSADDRPWQRAHDATALAALGGDDTLRDARLDHLTPADARSTPRDGAATALSALGGDTAAAPPRGDHLVPTDTQPTPRAETVTALSALGGDREMAQQADHLTPDDVRAAPRSDATGDAMQRVGAKTGGAVCVSGTDAVSTPQTLVVGDAGSRHGGNVRDAGAPFETRDTMRAEFDGTSARASDAACGEGGALAAGAVVSIGTDRPVWCSSATWHFPTSSATEVSAARQAPQPVQSHALGGLCLHDRLDQPHEPDWRRHEYRLTAAPPADPPSCGGAGRVTPNPMTPRGAVPPLQQHRVVGTRTDAVERSRRSLPMTTPLSPTPTVMR